MKILDLTEKHEPLYFHCLEDWSDEMREAGDHKACWYREARENGLRVKLAATDDGIIGGMIQYGPIEQSFAEGEDLYFIYCIWVHGYKQGRGNLQRQGMGKALLRAAEQDTELLGAKGIAAWGVILPFWMRASWYRKQGFKSVDRQGIRSLLWKPYTPDALPPRWPVQKRAVEPLPGKVTVDAFMNGWCPAQNLSYERAKRAAASFGNQVVFRETRTADRDTFRAWGISDAVYIDGKEINTGPPPAYEKIRKHIARRVKKRGRHPAGEHTDWHG